MRRLLSVFALAPFLACAGVDPNAFEQLLGALVLGQGQQLSNGTIVAGLKEALRVGTDRTVSSTSRRDGFLGNPLIRIPLPRELDGMARGLRAVGFRRQVDELEVEMNRAAESAAGEAADVFWGAIKQMSFADARAVLDGGDTAATDYFRARTSDELQRRFTPIVDESMRKVGLARLYADLVTTVEALPLVPAPDLDLREYVTSKALGGLFTVLSQEEARIRKDPAARTNELLRTVFGSA